MTPPRVLIIAGSDSGGGAGIQADIKTVTMLGGHAMTAITAITAQNTLGVQAVMPVPTEMVVAQIDSVVSDIGVDAVKIGMIGSPETAHAVADRLERLAVPIVFDPVMVATSGSTLADESTISAFGRLIEISRLITPNAPELAALVGGRLGSLAEMERQAVELASRYEELAVLAKGGHLLGTDVTDLLVDRDLSVQCWTAQRVETRHTHGTGCTLASAIAAGLGSSLRLSQAVDQARRYVHAALGAAPGLGQGHGPMGHALGAVPWQLIHNKEE